MRKLLQIVLIGFFIILITLPASAGQIKSITLTDGSVIKGEIKSLVNGTYSVRTSNLGIVEIKDSDIVSINAPSVRNLKNTTTDSTQLKQQIGAMQQTLFSDQDIMEDIKGLMANEEIMRIITDEEFMGTVMSYDQQKIENDPKTQQLLNNPEIQKLIHQIEKKFNASTQNQ